ncbi:MAG TPA: protease complex subunit PrcB family protein [Candidatus Paceibacterota bacterium]|nr:protease complex subunit PrcB family protein [Candidatus Paceibacterota bacterium]
MRDSFIVLGTCIAAIALGAGLFFFLPEDGPQEPVVDMANRAADVQAAQPVVNAPVGFVVIDAGDSANVVERKNYAARDAESFARLWAMAHGTDGTTPLPVDFDENYVIGVFMGQQPSGGHAIEVSSVTDRGGERVVAVTLTRPGSTCVVTNALTSPYQFVVVPNGMNAHENVDTELVSVCG